jgi:hypothetical protein
VSIDTLNPTVTVNIVDASLSDTDNTSDVTFTFSETVSGFTAGDVTVSGGVLSDFTQVDGDSYTATFTATDGVETTGSVSVADGTYTDVAGNTGSGGSDTVSIDTLNPTVTVNIVDASLSDTDCKTVISTSTSLVTFEFSETVSGFTEDDVTVSGGTLSDFTQVDGDSYTATFTATDGAETTGSVSVTAGSYTDVALNTGSGGSDTVSKRIPTGGWDIEGRARNGRTGFEAVLFTPANPSPGVTLNPAGAPVWQFGQPYDFRFDYRVATGSATWSIDFNRDGDFADSQESATSVSDTLIGQSFKYAGIYLQGSDLSSATLNDLVINGENFGPYTAGNAALVQQFEDSCGLFGDITATGSFTFSANGGSDERPRFWFRLGEEQSVPTPLTPAFAPNNEFLLTGPDNN